jgi:serine/threonine-protein kinase
MGEVYKVEHVFLKATRVIKVIRPQISETADAHERFLREAQLATKVQHPNVATLHDFSALPDGSHYMVWEYIEGENLAQVIRKRGTLAPAHATRLAEQALAGLEAIHRAGIIHRDISPENLMITRDERGDDRLKIIDLGVAKADEGDYAVTRTGIFVGKLRYSSPEQLGILGEGEKIDGRADLYSLAIVLYEMLTGRPPFEATSPHQYILHHSRETNVQQIDLTRVPNELRPVLTKALERDRAKRFATAREFANALEKVEQRLPTQEDETLRVTPPPAATTIRTPLPASPRRQTGLVIAIAALLLVFGALTTWHFRSKPEAVVTAPPPPAPQPQPQAQPAVPTTVEVTHPAPVQRKIRKQLPSTDLTYVEGGDSSTNESALAFAQQRLHGVTRVALDTPGEGRRLAELVRNSDLTIADDADTVIHFHGIVTRMRFGRKRRSGQATITRNGQIVFRWEMRPEEYRVGDIPAEAFARVLSDVFGR